jgi:hypothetical protein
MIVDLGVNGKTSSQSQSHVTTDGQSAVGQSVLMLSPILDPRPYLCYCRVVAVLSMWGPSLLVLTYINSDQQWSTKQRSTSFPRLRSQGQSYIRYGHNTYYVQKFGHAGTRNQKQVCWRKQVASYWIWTCVCTDIFKVLSRNRNDGRIN